MNLFLYAIWLLAAMSNDLYAGAKRQGEGGRGQKMNMQSLIPAEGNAAASQAHQENAKAEKNPVPAASKKEKEHAAEPKPAEVKSAIEAAPAVVAPPAAQPVESKTETPPAPAPVVETAPVEIKAPEPTPAPTVPDSPELEAEEIKGIDTVDVEDPQGNWLLKRIWWQKAERQYEKIKSLVASIIDHRVDYFDKRTLWDKDIFDPFYQEIGVGRGVLEELLATLIAQLQDERNREGALNEEERTLLFKVESEKATLEQLQKDVQRINDIDAKIDEAITLMFKQVKNARNYEEESWQLFKGIARELNDKTAREMYFGMYNHWENINSISEYLQGSFMQYFDQLGVLAKEQTQKIVDTIKELKEKGIDFKKEWQNINDKDKIDKERQEKKAAEEEARRKEEENRGFFKRITNKLSSVMSSTWKAVKSGASSLWDFTFGRLFAPKKVKEEPLPAVPEPTSEKHAQEPIELSVEHKDSIDQDKHTNE